MAITKQRTCYCSITLAEWLISRTKFAVRSASGLDAFYFVMSTILIHKDLLDKLLQLTRSRLAIELRRMNPLKHLRLLFFSHGCAFAPG